MAPREGVAAHASKTGKLGCVMPLKVSDTLMALDAFAQGDCLGPSHLCFHFLLMAHVLEYFACVTHEKAMAPTRPQQHPTPKPLAPTADDKSQDAWEQRRHLPPPSFCTLAGNRRSKSNEHQSSKVALRFNDEGQFSSSLRFDVHNPTTFDANEHILSAIDRALSA